MDYSARHDEGKVCRVGLVVYRSQQKLEASQQDADVINIGTNLSEERDELFEEYTRLNTVSKLAAPPPSPGRRWRLWPVMTQNLYCNIT